MTDPRKMSTSATLAKKVFQVTELLERILCFVSPLDVYHLWESMLLKNVYYTINDPKWQQHMGLMPDLKSFHVPVVDLVAKVGLQFDGQTLSVIKNGPINRPGICLALNNEDNTRIDFRTKWEELSKIERSMLFIQPPTGGESFNIKPSCCCYSPSDIFEDHGRHDVNLDPNVVVTFGQLVDDLAWLQDTHRDCSRAGEHEKDENGRIWPMFAIEVTIKNPKYDPTKMENYPTPMINT